MTAPAEGLARPSAARHLANRDLGFGSTVS
jgi:hypothetical protein